MFFIYLIVLAIILLAVVASNKFYLAEQKKKKKKTKMKINNEIKYEENMNTTLIMTDVAATFPGTRNHTGFAKRTEDCEGRGYWETGKKGYE
jgi:hypothetical protein